MASTFVNDLRLSEMATGDNSGSWGTVTNVNLELIGEALGFGTEAITTNADTHASTIADGVSDPVRAIFIKYTGTLDSACTITIGPNTVNKFCFIHNATSGSQSIIISQGSGANVTIATGQTKGVYLDGGSGGAAVVDAFATLSVGALDVAGVAAAATFEPDGDTAAGDNAAIGYTAALGIIVTGQGSTNDITLVNDADATVLAVPTGTTNVDIVGVATAATFEPDGDTAAGDNAAIGYTAAEGLILTGQGSTGDVTIKNDADALVAHVPTGTTGVTFAGAIDVDGIANLDVIDVDGAANFAADVTFATGADIITASAGGSNFRAGVNAGNSIASGGNYNVAVGDEAGTAISTGDYNTAVGYNALATESAGAGSTAFGAGALQRQLLGNGTDSNNVGIGYVAGTKITTGKNNVIVGRAAYNVTTASNNIAIGALAMSTESTGQRSVAIGTSALATQNVTDASLTYNVAVGFNAGITTTTGSLNTFVGGLSGDATTTGFYNSCLGIASLGALTTGAHNVGVGDDSNPTVTTGNRNLCIGRYAGYGVTTGSDNIVMGYLAGYAGGGSNQMTGGSNHLIGNYTNVAAAANTTCIVIGHSVAGKGSNTAFIGGSGGAYQQNNSADWSTTSDRRLKKNIVDSTIGLAEINQLQVRNFEYRTEDEITELDGKIDKVDVQGVQIGVIAQEIQAVLPECVETTSQGVLSVSPDNIKWHLVKAVQELSAANTALAARITALEGA